MRYYTKGNRYSAGFLRNVGRTAYANMRQNPVATAEMERGNSVSTYVDADIDVRVRISQKSEGPDVSVVERSIDLVEVILPKTEHWAEQYGVVAAPSWLEFTTKTDLMDHSFGGLERIFFSDFTLKEIAVLLGCDIRDIVETIQSAEADLTGFPNRLLAASVRKPNDDPEQWVVDIRGFGLSMVMANLAATANVIEPAVDSDPVIEVPAE